MSMLCRFILFGLKNKQRNAPLFSGQLLRSHQTKSRSKWATIVFNKCGPVIESCKITVEKCFPAGVKFYKVFTTGGKLFKNDFLILCRAIKKSYSPGLSSLTRKELEVYYELPKDIFKTAPVVFIGTLVPLGGLIFIIAYKFPKHLLTHHFWSAQQVTEFSIFKHKQRLQYYKTVFKCMEKGLYSLKDQRLRTEMNQILQCIKNSVHPDVNLVLSIKPLFENAPFSLEHLPGNHVIELLKLYDLHKGWSRRKRLHATAKLIKLMDQAIIKEGGVELLNLNEMKWHCFFRGVNPFYMRNDEMLIWLRTWLSLSHRIDEKSYSLLLHCPILLGYRQLSNKYCA